MTTEEFEQILKEIQPYTDYIYLHVKGEPLLHPQLDKLLTLCEVYHIKVNITTNGTLFPKIFPIIQKHAIHQINFSLHCESDRPIDPLDIFKCVDQLSNEVLINYRLWAQKSQNLDPKAIKIVEKLKAHYKLSPEKVEKIKTEAHTSINSHIFVDRQLEFAWPSVENDFCGEEGYCYGLKNHLAILVDGTVVPCCLDGEGVITLGNIFKQPLKDILESVRYRQIKKGFENRQAIESLCQHCSYKKRFDKKK